jgi:hypothetical protein
MHRNLSRSESKKARKYFPNLDLSKVEVTGEATRSYNCLAWTLGITSVWLWPWARGRRRRVSETDFRGLYDIFARDLARKAHVAVFGTSTRAMTHASLSLSDGERWESKLGQWLRIRHPLEGLESKSYGKVQKIFDRASLLCQVGTKDLWRESPSHHALTPEQVRRLNRKVEMLDGRLVRSFRGALRRWISTWDHPDVQISSDPLRRTMSREYHDLIKLGRPIEPLLILELADPKNFFVLQVLEHIFPQLRPPVRERDDPAFLLGEQGRVKHVVNRWFELEG